MPIDHHLSRLFPFVFFKSDEEKQLANSVRAITGVQPVNMELYKIATIHRSTAKQNVKGHRESNDRLEYLGDAILGAVVAEYLFKKYPLRNEGFLTEIRSRIVNRSSLNQAALKMGVERIAAFTTNKKSQVAYKSIYGDTLEAIIGAIYLDRGYGAARKFIVQYLIKPHFDLDRIIEDNQNYKSQVIEWAHRENKTVRFEIVEVKGKSHNREFHAELIVDGQTFTRGTGPSKKKAEQDAAQKSCEKLNM
jgi:ribonuclease-3